MLVYREEGATKEEDVFETMDVQMVKKPGKGLGLSIVGRKNGPGVFISDVVSRARERWEGREESWAERRNGHWPTVSSHARLVVKGAEVL